MAQESPEDFLVLKSTAQQKKEGVEQPVDTAYVKEIDGKLMLFAVFDIKNSTEEDISLEVTDGKLNLKAQYTEDTEDAVLRKTILRSIDLPEYADVAAMRHTVNAGVLTVEMPLILPTKAAPQNPTVVPIISENGHRKICLKFMIGCDFTVDDLKVVASGHDLSIKASYETEVGVQGQQITRREFKKQFRLPETISVGEVKYQLMPNGVLEVVIMLDDDATGCHYRCNVTTEEVTNNLPK